MNCQPGDLAVIVNSLIESNIGAFVRVQKKAPESNNADDPIWVVKAAHPICFEHAGITFRRKIAPVQDSSLKPIGGSAVLKDLAEEAKLYMQAQMFDFYEVNEYGTITDPRGKYPEIKAEPARSPPTSPASHACHSSAAAACGRCLTRRL